MKYRHHSAQASTLIYDWYTLGAALDIRPHILAWVLRERNNMQHRIRLGKRTVYRSAPALLAVQNRLITLIEPLVDALPEEDAIIAYRRGRPYMDALKRQAGATLLIMTDVRKYYDHVHLDHLEAALAEQGFTPAGARLIGRYCVVNTKRGLTLQQGSPASPALSNLVGARCFDRPIRHWLHANYPGLSVTYLRYCDNLALFVRGEVPEDFPQAYKEAVKHLLAERGFQTHHWGTITHSHPKISQKFLGIVLNHQARLERSRTDELRAILYNCCLRGIDSEGRRYLYEKGLATGREVKEASPEYIERKMTQLLRGHISYATPINQRQALWLRKLYDASKTLNSLKDKNLLTRPEVRHVIHGYRDDAESSEAYVARVLAAVEQARAGALPYHA